MIRPGIKTVLVWLTLFSMAMGFMESAVVVYLREIYYPSGFSFPLIPLSGRITIVEMIREMATMLMLLSVGVLAGRNARQRFAWFIYCFAVWDIFYYVFLKITIQWPSSFFTWDILFLIPIIWTGPVITAILVSFTMILLACIILFAEEKTGPAKITGFTIIPIIIGAVLIFISFIWSFTSYVTQAYSLKAILNAGTVQNAMLKYIPAGFNWYLFTGGEIALMTGIYSLYAEFRKAYHSKSRIQNL